MILGTPISAKPPYSYVQTGSIGVQNLSDSPLLFGKKTHDLGQQRSTFKTEGNRPVLLGVPRFGPISIFDGMTRVRTLFNNGCYLM